MAKGAQAKAAKAEAANAKQDREAQAKEQAEADKWADGAKGKNKKAALNEEKLASKASAAAAKKQQQEEEEAELERSSKKAASSKTSKGKSAPKPPAKVEEYSATGMENALDMLDLVTSKNDKATLGAKASKIDTHPERRFKAAFDAYKEKRIPELRQEQKLRLQQYEEICYKEFQKHPDNPFNSMTLDYNSTQQDKVEAMERTRQEREELYRVS